MNRPTIGFLIFSALLAAFLIARSVDTRLDKFIIIPEPRLHDLFNEDWSIDENSMRKHYQIIFKNMSIEEASDTLREGNVAFKFISDNEIQFGVSKAFLPVMASYGCLVKLSFSDGMFENVEDISGCGLTA